jgi:hypothetical protein
LRWRLTIFAQALQVEVAARQTTGRAKFGEEFWLTLQTPFSSNTL